MGGSSLWWTLGGAVAGAALLHALPPAIIGGLLGYLIWQLREVQGQQRRLEDRLRALEGGAIAPPAPTPAVVAVPEPVVVATPPEPVIEAPQADAWAPQPSEPAWTPAPSQPHWMERVWQMGVEWITGGNPLARAGIVVLFFGGAFLAKYAAEHSHFSLEMRFAGIAAVALLLLGFGWRLRHVRSGYAQTLQGGGVAGLYLTIFAAARLYALLPPTTALASMVAVAVLAAALAVVQDALALAVIGSAGGFLAPLLVSTGSADPLALFSYYTVLNAGIFAVAWFRAWRVLNLVGLFFTFGITGVFRATAYVPDQLMILEGFLWLFFLMYASITLLFPLRQPAAARGYVSSSLMFGLPLATFGIHATLVHDMPYALAWTALVLALFYGALALLCHKRETLRLSAEGFGALTVIFASLAAPLALDARTTAATWAVEGAGLLWLGQRQNRASARAFGLLLQLLGGIGYLYSLHDLGALPPLLNSATLGALMLAVAGLLSGLWLHRATQRSSYEREWDTLAALWGLGWWLAGGCAEIQRSLPDHAASVSLVWLAGSALLLQAWGLREQWPLARTLSLTLTPLAALLGLSASAAQSHAPLAGWLAWGWPLVLAAHYALLWREDRAGMQRPAILHAGGVWLFALLAAWELHGRAEDLWGGVWPALPWGVVPALLLILLSLPYTIWPPAKHEEAYRVLAATPLALLALLWIAGINLGNPGDAAPLPYWPLLNPMDLSVAMALIATALWWRSLAAAQRGRLWSGGAHEPVMAYAGLGFLWLNSALLRALHHLAYTPWSAHGIAHSTLAQSALSVLWGVLGFAAMTLAARRSLRGPWMAGAGLMTAVVAKLFLVDLSDSGTLERIVSFLVVGGLLVVTGYVSPLPPRKAEEAAG